MAVICNNCGTSLVFDPKLQKLSCRNCGGTAEYSETSDTDLYEQDMYTCSTCGAELFANDTDITMFCQHCGNTKLVFSRIVKSKRPDTIIPFKLSKEDAVKKVKDHLAHYFFLEKEVKECKFDCVRGIYIPYYVFDFEYHASYIFTRIYNDGDGEKRIEYERSAHANFDHFMLESSVSLNNSLGLDLNPFDISQTKDFDPGYLQGFYSDIADEDPEDLYKRTKEIVKDLMIREARKQEVPNAANVENSDYRFKFHGNPKYALFPVWFLTTTYNGKPLTLMVNGQTGKVVGGIPYNKKKLKTLTAIICAITMPVMAAAGFVAAYAGIVMPPVIVWILIGCGVIGGLIQAGIYKLQGKVNDMISYSTSQRLFKLTDRRKE